MVILYYFHGLVEMCVFFCADIKISRNAESDCTPAGIKL